MEEKRKLEKQGISRLERAWTIIAEFRLDGFRFGQQRYRISRRSTKDMAERHPS